MSRDSFKGGLWRLGKHSLFSLGGTLTDTLVLWICSDLFFDGYVLENVVSPCISFECANVVNFFLSSRIVFRDRSRGLSHRVLFRKFIAYNLTYTTTFFLKMPVLLSFQWLTQWDIVWCNLIALCIIGFVNFFMNDKMIFRNRPDVSATASEEVAEDR